ncbi:MAG: GNAT family N-acetyltransferase, partial [Bacteroidota bacterium]
DLTSENWEQFHKNLAAEDAYIHILKIAKCFVCEADDEIIGVAYFVPSGNPTEIFDASWSYLRMIGVHPDYRGKGIGIQLTQHCIEFAKQTNEHLIALHTSEFMDAARYMYEKLGFKRIKELQPLFGKRYWLYHMKLT